MSSVPGLERSPGEGNGNPLQYSYLETRNLAGYKSRGSKESDITEHMRTHMHTRAQHTHTQPSQHVREPLATKKQQQRTLIRLSQDVNNLNRHFKTVWRQANS